MKKSIVVCAIIASVLALIYFILLFVIISNDNRKIKNDVDYVIVLGAKVNGNSPSLTLQYRLDQAFEYYSINPKTKIIVSGGQGVDESYSEALVMKKYLLKLGVEEDKVIVEDKSTSSFENFKFSKKLMQKNANVGVITTDFHIFRSSIICKRVFEKECEMESAKNVSGYMGIYSLLREPFALIKTFFRDK